METPLPKNRPTLESERLVLRPFDLTDATRVQILAGDRAVAATTALIPHPYEDGMAEQWIGTHQARFEKGEEVTLAIALKTNRELVGAVGLSFNWNNGYGILGYWIGKPYWGNGYCTEASRAILRYAFHELQLNRIWAQYLQNNPASGRVMQKIGMQHEGRLRQHAKKWGEFFDVEAYGILRSEFLTTENKR